MFDFHRRKIHQSNQNTPWHELWRQPLAAMIRMPWWLFFGTMIGIYLLEILSFGLVLSLDASHIVGDAPMGIPKPFAFALDAFLANSFDNLQPDSRFTYAVAVLDLIAGLITLSTLTAVVFSRLSSNEKPLIFSRHLCISNLKDGHLFCRFVTSDRSQWLNVSYTLNLIYDDELEPGLWQRRIAPLPVLNTGTPQLSQTATLTHRIDKSSPITQLGIDALLMRNAVIMPLVEGIDEITGASLLQTHLYKINDIRIGFTYGNLVMVDQHGERRININRLNEVTPCES
jgi:inward rectifier potassium channel